jgi:hypothetical protein
MQSNWWLNLLSPLEIIALAAVLFAILQRRILSRWPSLFTALLLEMTTDFVLGFLIQNGGHYKIYFYGFWITTGIQAILRLWIIGDIVRSFPGIGFLPRSAYLFVGTAGAVMALASAVYCYQGSARLDQDIVSTTVLLNRCVNIAWLTFAVVMMGSIKRMNLGWSPQGAGMASGIILRICTTAVASELLSRPEKWLRLAADGLQSVCSIAIFVFWVYTIARNPLPHGPDVTDLDPEVIELNRLEPLLAGLHSRER